MNGGVKIPVAWKVVKGCWICTSHKPNDAGYPRLSVNGRVERVSRHMYRLYKGEIPEGLIIRHTCDTPACINPDHLLAGTTADNVMDKVMRGRSSKGDKHGLSKLSLAEAREIKRDTTTSIKELAERYNVHRATIDRIRHGRNWKHLEV